MNASSISSNKVTPQKSKSMKGEVSNAPTVNRPNEGTIRTIKKTYYSICENIQKIGNQATKKTIQKITHPLSYFELKELYMLTKI